MAKARNAVKGKSTKRVAIHAWLNSALAGLRTAWVWSTNSRWKWWVFGPMGGLLASAILLKMTGKEVVVWLASILPFQSIVETEVVAESVTKLSDGYWEELDPELKQQLDGYEVLKYLDSGVTAVSVPPSKKATWWIRAVALPGKNYDCQVKRVQKKAVSISINLYSSSSAYDGEFNKLYHVEIVHPDLFGWSGQVMSLLRFDQSPSLTAAYNDEGLLSFDIGEATIDLARRRDFLAVELHADAREHGNNTLAKAPSFLNHRFSLKGSARALRALKACSVNPVPSIRDDLWHEMQ